MPVICSYLRSTTNFYSINCNFDEVRTLSATTPFTSYAQNVHHQPKHMLEFSDVFPKQLGIFRPNFTCLLYVSIYARKQIFIQLSPTVTKKLHHIKCNYPACASADGRHFEHIVVVALNMALLRQSCR